MKKSRTLSPGDLYNTFKATLKDAGDRVGRAGLQQLGKSAAMGGVLGGSLSKLPSGVRGARTYPNSTQGAGMKASDSIKSLTGNALKFKKKKKNWITGAIKRPGALHKELGVLQGKKIPLSKLAAATKKGGKEGKRARLAETLKTFHKKKKIAKVMCKKHRVARCRMCR